MVRGLQQVSWRKVDVSFHSALWPFLAHNAIHVRLFWMKCGGTILSAAGSSSLISCLRHVYANHDESDDDNNRFGRESQIWYVERLSQRVLVGWVTKFAGETRMAALWGSRCDCACGWHVEATRAVCVFRGKLMKATKGAWIWDILCILIQEIRAQLAQKIHKQMPPCQSHCFPHTLHRNSGLVFCSCY